MSRLEEGSSSSSKRRRRGNYGYTKSSKPRRKQHLYLALDDWKGGYSIHKLDADDILDQEPAAAAAAGGGGEREHMLPEPAAVRIASPVRGPMAFAALGTNIFVATNPRCRRDHAPQTLVYDTETAALSVGPRLPDSLHDLGAAMAVGEKLYALTSVCFRESPSLASTTILDPDPAMEWSWNSLPSPPPYNGIDIVCYAVHPDGRTIFLSTRLSTHSFDTSNGVWKELGDWMLPFRGQAYFDDDLDAWVGLHNKEDGYICCCPVASRSATTTRQPECRMLKEKLFLRMDEGKYPTGRHLRATLTYMGDSRFCLVDNVLRSKDVLDAVLHVTLFSLKYDQNGDLQTKIRRTTRSYAVSKNTRMFSHAAFWM